MVDKKSILSKLTKKFAELGTALGCSEPFVQMQDGFETHLYMRRKRHALKAEISWYSGVVYVCVVRLIDSKLPPWNAMDTYSDGSWCKKYIQKIYGIPPVKKTKIRKSSLTKSWEDAEQHLCQSLAEKTELILSNPKVLLDFMDSIS